MNNEEKILSILDTLLEQVVDIRSGQVNLEDRFDLTNLKMKYSL